MVQCYSWTYVYTLVSVMAIYTITFVSPGDGKTVGSEPSVAYPSYFARCTVSFSLACHGCPQIGTAHSCLWQIAATEDTCISSRCSDFSHYRLTQFCYTTVRLLQFILIQPGVHWHPTRAKWCIYAPLYWQHVNDATSPLSALGVTPLVKESSNVWLFIIWKAFVTWVIWGSRFRMP